jgi:RNA ligase (TIGR02306 family)
MSSFAVEVTKILSVDHHPDADRLSIIQIKGFLCISGKLEDGSHRYQAGDLVAYIPEAAVLPEDVLRFMDFWDHEKNVGFLAGKKGDRVKAKRLRGIFSQGVLYPISKYDMGCGEVSDVIESPNGEHILTVLEGDNVAEFLGITKYEPPVPTNFAGDVCNISGNTHKYDFESVQNYPDTFDSSDEVVATEKLHGTHVQIGYVPGLNNDELFFDGNLYVGSKGMAAQGLVFKDNEANALKNVYVRMLKPLVENGFGELIKAISDEYGQPVRVFGEIFGEGIQDLTYGFKKPTLYIFDIQIGYEFVSYEVFEALAAKLGIPVAPVLYRGQYDLAALEAVRDGKDTLSGIHVREGIVIKTVTEGRSLLRGRKIGKWVSPDYILRKNATEFN